MLDTFDDWTEVDLRLFMERLVEDLLCGTGIFGSLSPAALLQIQEMTAARLRTLQLCCSV